MPSPTIDLGRDRVITVGGVTLTGVRSVSAASARETIESKGMDGEIRHLPAARSVSLEIETISREDGILLQQALDELLPVVITCRHAVGEFIVTNVTESEPLDDVVSYAAQLQRTFDT